MRLNLIAAKYVSEFDMVLSHCNQKITSLSYFPFFKKKCFFEDGEQAAQYVAIGIPFVLNMQQI